MTHYELLAILKGIVAPYCKNTFQKKPNTTVIIGLAESSSTLRNLKIQEIYNDIKNYKKDNRNLFTDVSIQRTLVSHGTRYQSNAKLIKVDVGRPKPYVILLKPKTTVETRLDPKEFKLTGKTHTVQDYLGTLVSEIYTHASLPDDVKFFLAGISEDVGKRKFNVAGRRYTMNTSEETALFFNDSSFTFYQNLNKQFGEVLAPFIAQKDFPKLVKFEFPSSQTEMGQDFSAYDEKGRKYNYSVKTGVTEKVNTVKPETLMMLMKGRTIPQHIKLEYDVLDILNTEKAELGVVEVANKLGYTRPINIGEVDQLQDAITFIETKSKNMNFGKLLSFAVEQQLTFIKFTYRKNNVMEFSIVKSDDIDKIQRSDKPIQLRGKGFKEGGRMREKLGLTPP